jgi:hypothetical protein
LILKGDNPVTVEPAKIMKLLVDFRSRIGIEYDTERFIKPNINNPPSEFANLKKVFAVCGIIFLIMNPF